LIILRNEEVLIINELNEKVEYKTCTKCSETKPANNEYFHRQKKHTQKKGEFYDLTSWCKDCIREKQRGYYDENRDQYNLRSYNRYINNKEEYHQRKKKWVNDNLDHVKQYQKDWQQSNPNKIKVYNHMHSDHNITEHEWEICKEYFNWSCAYCGLTEIEHKIIEGQQLHKEHVFHNGSDEIDNCAPSCKSCNSTKHDRDFEKWYNESNPNFTKRRLNRIVKWILKDALKWVDGSN
jgi:hypothetical protein